MENKEQAILITGAGGFVGKNLVAALEGVGYTNLLKYDIDTPKALLKQYAGRAAFVFHLAGINRPKNADEFYAGNAGLTEELLFLLEEANNPAPVLVTSSIQATLDNDYGKSKQMAEQALFAHAEKTGAKVCVYRLAGVFGKWCRPNYNSVVATFCNNIACGEPITVRDAEAEVSLVYIDDVVAHFMAALAGNELRDGAFCIVRPEYTATLGFLADTIASFRAARSDFSVPNLADPLTSKLYSTYLSYLPTGEFSYPLIMHEDVRGSFTEFLRTPDRGQVSVNISNPGIVKGNHWHHSKHEKFLVVRGEAVIRFRKVGEAEVFEYRVSGKKLEVVEIPTGYTHNIENVGADELVTVMWASEAFDPQKPDTQFLPV